MRRTLLALRQSARTASARPRSSTSAPGCCLQQFARDQSTSSTRQAPAEGAAAASASSASFDAAAAAGARAATSRTSETRDQASSRDFGSRSPKRAIEQARRQARQAGSALYAPTPEEVQSSARELLELAGVPDLPDKLLMRACTLKGALSQLKALGHPESGDHNALLAFIGRRTMQMHLALLVSRSFPILSSPHASQPPTATTPESSASAKSAEPTLPSTSQTRRSHQVLDRRLLSAWLETHELGAQVGRELALERMMRWSEVRAPDGEWTGLYKARGHTLEALVGAVHMTHGIDASNRMFQLLVWPYLGTVPRYVRAHVDALLEASSGASAASSASSIASELGAGPTSGTEQAYASAA